MASERNAIKLLPHPSPRASYMLKPASGSSPPIMDRKTVFAATAEAAYIVKASMRYCLSSRIIRYASSIELGQTYLDANKHRDDSDAEEQRPEQRNRPLLVKLDRPAVDEKPNGYQPASPHQRQQSIFGFQLAIVFRRLSFQESIARPSDDEQSDEHSDAAADIHQAHRASGEAVDFLEYEGVRCIQQIKHPVHQSTVNRHQANDWREEQHLDWPHNRSLHANFLS